MQHLYKATFIALATYLLIVPMILFAQTPAGGGVDPNSLQGQIQTTGREAGFNESLGGPTGLAQVAGIIVRLFLSLTGIIFVSYTVYGGFLWLTSAGNEERVTKAKSIIRNGIIGLIVIFASGAIYLLIATILTGTQGLPSGTPPTGS